MGAPYLDSWWPGNETLDTENNYLYSLPPAVASKTISNLLSGNATSSPWKIDLPDFGDSTLGNLNATIKVPDTLKTPSSITPKKPNLGQKAGAFLKLNGSMIGEVADAANNVSDAIFGLKRGMDGPNAGLTTAIDNAYNSASDMVMKVNPMVGGIMKAAGFLGNTLNKAGGGTDGMTKVDAVMNSAPMTLMTLGLNGFLGDTTESLTKNEEAFAQVGSSYGGTGSVVDDALSKAGKKYGMLSGGARTEANRAIRKAKMLLDVMAGIGDRAQDSFAIQSSMSAINGNRRAFAMQGGYDQSSVRVGKSGLKLLALEEARERVEKYRKGKKTTDPFDTYLLSLPENLRDTVNFRARDYWEFNGRPKDFDEAISKGMFKFDEKDNLWHGNSVAENPATGEVEFMKSSSHPTHHMEIDWYNSDDGAEFRSQYELVKSEPYWKYIRRKTPQEFKEGGSINPTEIILVLETPEFKEGGTIESPITYIELVTEVEEFKEGGSINVIPDGSLHAHKHHMDIEGITPKGIPVVSEKEGGELEQQAEIEKEEIIFRLEVTKKLEELAKDGSDEAAIEAGKLLVNEILYNTIDKTNNLL